MARENDPALPLAEEALSNALAASTPVDGRGYCQQPESNLVASVTDLAWKIAKADLDDGRGSELDEKFLAAYSSAALAVNAFSPLSGGVDLPAESMYEGPIRFEQQRSAWASGYWPTLDVIVGEPDSSRQLFVESKCMEFLRKGHADFSKSFVKHAVDHLSPSASDTFVALAKDPFCFDPLDARQMAKHFLAAKRATLDAGDPTKVTLLAVTWEPADASEYPVFERHRKALEALAAALPDDSVKLRALSYPELWDHWDATGDAGLREHVAFLRERYDVKLAPR